MLPSRSVPLQRVLSDRAWQFQLGRYLAIGGLVFIIDVGLFWALTRAGVYLAVATTIAYATAATTHFTLNKYANFRTHDRPVHKQAGTYAAVAFVCWLVTLTVIEAGVRVFGLAPLAAKIVAVAVNVPAGFIGHRTFTFGPGLLSALRRILAR